MSFDARKMSLDIPGDWSFTKISDIAGINESSISSDDSFDYIRYIDISSVSSDKMETPKLMRLDDAPSRAKRIIKQGDIIISTVRPNLKQFYLCNFEIDNHIVSTGFCVVSPKSSKYRWYLYSFLTSEIFTEYLIRVADGAAYPAFSYKEIRDAIIPLPSDEYLSFISSTSKSIFNKVHLNQQTNETLEAMAQAIFKSWFVDFDPVRAKLKASEDGRDPNRAAIAAIAGVSLEQDWGGVEAALNQKLDRMSDKQRQQLEKTAGLFPGTLEESEIGEMPEGWGISKLEDYMTLSYGKGLRKKDREEGSVPVYGSGGLTGTHNESLIDGPGIIVGRKGTVGSIYWEDQDFWPIDTVFYVEPKNEIDLSFYYYLLNTLGLDDMNTDAAVPGLNRNNAYRLQIPDFPKELMIQFGDLTSDMQRVIKSNKTEKKTLEDLRDTLLPKLISGEILV